METERRRHFSTHYATFSYRTLVLTKFILGLRKQNLKGVIWKTSYKGFRIVCFLTMCYFNWKPYTQEKKLTVYRPVHKALYSSIWLRQSTVESRQPLLQWQEFSWRSGRRKNRREAGVESWKRSWAVCVVVLERWTKSHAKTDRLCLPYSLTSAVNEPWTGHSDTYTDQELLAGSKGWRVAFLNSYRQMLTEGGIKEVCLKFYFKTGIFTSCCKLILLRIQCFHILKKTTRTP